MLILSSLWIRDIGWSSTAFLHPPPPLCIYELRAAELRQTDLETASVLSSSLEKRDDAISSSPFSSALVTPFKRTRAEEKHGLPLPLILRFQ